MAICEALLSGSTSFSRLAPEVLPSGSSKRALVRTLPVTVTVGPLSGTTMMSPFWKRMGGMLPSRMKGYRSTVVTT